MADVLLQTKLYRPTRSLAQRPFLIPRPHLSHKLDSSLSRKLTLVSAPAGFGKTTLVATWLDELAEEQIGIGWLSLDEYDNDLVRFLAYLVAALQTAVPGIGETAVKLLQSPQPPPAETILTLLINHISQHDQSLVLALDDYHAVTTPAIHQALAFLLDHLPPQLHLLITTRSDPPLPLSRLRVRGQMVEIRTRDLRFTLDEVRLFFSQVMDLTLSNEQLAALEQLTEGWIAGLQLAGLSMQGRDDLSGFIASLTGSNRFILDYLTDEVLERRPKGTKDFLLQTSILNRLCGALCDAVTGQSEGQAILERLEQANLFLIPLDEERHWFRYHHLFAEVLRHRLLQEQPGHEPKLHRLAQEWLEQNGLLHEAVNHALAGHDFEQAADLIERVAGNLVRKGSSSSVTMWLDALPEEVVRSRPRLCLARGWTYIMGPLINLESADEWAQLALQATPANQLLDTGFAGEVASLQAMSAAIWDEVTRSIELSRQALESLPSYSPWRSVMAFTLGSTLFLAGDMAAAPPALEEALRLSIDDGAHYIQLNAASFLADVQVFQGHLNQAAEMYQGVLAWAGHGIPQKGALMAHGGLAHILCERNQLDAALSHIHLGIEQLEQVGGTWSALVLYRALARVQQACGHWTDALDSLDRAYQSGQRTQVRIVITQAAALHARLQLAQGDLEAAELWAANSRLTPDDPEVGHPGLREEEYLTLARVLSAQGRRAEALSLLNRLLQTAEAEERMGSAIVILILQALILQTQDNTARALKCLERALALAEPEGYCRAFLDEGRPMAELLRRAEQRGLFPNYVHKLLSAFPAAESTPSPADLLPEPLSERELEVLRLVATGASNQEIAGQLFIALSTAKKHVGNILVKLDTPNRIQAVARARELGLLP